MIGKQVVIFSETWPQYNGEPGQIVATGMIAVRNGDGPLEQQPAALVRMYGTPGCSMEWLVSDLREVDGVIKT